MLQLIALGGDRSAVSFLRIPCRLVSYISSVSNDGRDTVIREWKKQV